jgi:hypothetical protein
MSANGGPMQHGVGHRKSPMAPQRRLAGSVFWCAIVVMLGAGPATAHVSMDYPNGGEELEVGSVVLIRWSDEISHGPATYDLWYSTTGPDGPWIPIDGGLPPDTFVLNWVVPDAPSNQVRLRVKQDNDATDYFDISDSDLAIVGQSEPFEVDLDAGKDATIYEEGSGSRANGAGSYLFSGRNASQGGSAERRALVAFPIAGAIAAGSTIVSVSLELTMSKTTSGVQSVGLHRLLEDWNEGPSDPPGDEGGGATGTSGDVTWMHRDVPDVLWAISGGTFVQSASAALQVADLGTYTFSSTPELVDDVQGWLDDPSSNFGWVVVVDSPPTGSAKRFNSRENSTESSRPKLTIGYEKNPGKPTASFSFSPANPRLGDEVQFSDRSTGDPTSWQWDFGDGGTSQEQNPTHTYTTPGTRAVALVVRNALGDDTVVNEIVVNSKVLRPSRRVAPND